MTGKGDYTLAENRPRWILTPCVFENRSVAPPEYEHVFNTQPTGTFFVYRDGNPGCFMLLTQKDLDRVWATVMTLMILADESVRSDSLKDILLTFLYETCHVYEREGFH